MNLPAHPVRKWMKVGHCLAFPCSYRTRRFGSKTFRPPTIAFQQHTHPVTKKINAQLSTALHSVTLCAAEVFGPLRIDDAMAEYARALAIFRRLGAEYEWDQANIMFERGDLHGRADDPELAAKDLFAAAELFKKIDDHFMEAKSIMGLAELLDKCGHRAESRPYYEAAVAAVSQVKNQRNGAYIWFRYGLKLLELHEFEEGKSILTSMLSSDWLRPSQRLDVLKHVPCGKGTGT